jgi:hypothetical protein
MPRHPPVILLAIRVLVAAAGDDVIEIEDVDEGFLFGGNAVMCSRFIIPH